MVICSTSVALEPGVSRPIISLYERGELRVSSDLIIRLTEVLRVISDEFLRLTPPPRQVSMNDRRFLRRLDLIDRLPKMDRDALLRFINACVTKVQAGGAHSEHA
jgi:hypothetical protein